MEIGIRRHARFEYPLAVVYLELDAEDELRPGFRAITATTRDEIPGASALTSMRSASVQRQIDTDRLHRPLLFRQMERIRQHHCKKAPPITGAGYLKLPTDGSGID